MGFLMGGILWPIIKHDPNSADRGVLGFIIGALAGGALVWGRLGLQMASVIGSSIGAAARPGDAELWLAFYDALVQTLVSGAIGAMLILSLRSLSFVLAGAGTGLIFSLILSAGLRILNQGVLDSPLSSTQITLIVFFSIILFFGLLDMFPVEVSLRKK